MERRILFVGGGSGGHFYPLMAVAEELRSQNQPGLSLYYMGPRSYDPELLMRFDITFVRCPAGKLRRYFSFRNIIDFFISIFAFVVAFIKLLYIYPDVIFSKGSYTSVPITTAAWLLRIPIVVHESDATPGRSNKLAAPLAQRVFVAYQEAVETFPTKKASVIGIPTRSFFFASIPRNAPETLGIDPKRPLILVTGGSSGAERINNLILSSLDELLPTYTILHQVGTEHEELMRQTSIGLMQDTDLLQHYHVKGHMSGEEFSTALSLAALVISRAGSSTIHEIALKGKPSILIPIPEDVSHDQRTNAYTYARTGAASVIEEHNLTDNLLVAEITRIMGDGDVYQNMAAAASGFAKSDAAATIAQTLISIIDEH